MISQFLENYGYIAMAVLIVVFVFLKIVTISMFGLKEDKFRVFMISLRILSRPVIDNTYFERLRDYYKVSNKINFFCYTCIITMVVLFLLVKLYM